MLKKGTAVITALLLALCLGACGAERYHSFDRKVFGNGITFYAYLLGGNEKAAYNEMSAFLDDVNAEMSLSLSNSAISRLNDLPVDPQTGLSEPVEVSASAAEIVELSLQLYDETEGAFNIAVAPLSKLWHVDTEGLNLYGGMFPSEPAPPPPDYAAVLATAEVCRLKTAGNSHLLCYEQDGKHYLQKSTLGDLSAEEVARVSAMRIDLGAIAKGYSADVCVEILQKHSVRSALINISGNICVYGKWYNDGSITDWDIGLISPRPRGELFGSDLCVLRIPENYTLVTSGDYQRYYTYTYPESGALLTVAHIVDGRTGLPIDVGYDSQTGQYYNLSDRMGSAGVVPIMSATVIGRSSARADAMATALCVLGYDKAKALTAQADGGAVLISADGRMALVHVGATDNGRGISLTHTDDSRYSGYKAYKIEEVQGKN